MVLRGFVNDNQNVSPRSYDQRGGKAIAIILSNGNWPRQTLDTAGIAPDVAGWQGRSGYEVACEVGKAVLNILPADATERRTEMTHLVGVCAAGHNAQIATSMNTAKN